MAIETIKTYVSLKNTTNSPTHLGVERVGLAQAGRFSAYQFSSPKYQKIKSFQLIEYLNFNLPLIKYLNFKYPIPFYQLIEQAMAKGQVI